MLASLRARSPLASLAAFAAIFCCSATRATAQDTCATAVAVFDGLNGLFTNVGAEDPLTPTFSCRTARGIDAWFTYTATGTGLTTIRTCAPGGTLSDTVLAVYTGTCGSLTQAGCNDDASGCGLRSSLTLLTTAATSYIIRVKGYGATEAGTFPLEIVPPPVGPANNECTGALTIVNGPNGPYNNIGATTSSPAWPCGSGGNDVWFNYTASCYGTATIDTCGSAFDTVLEVFSGTCVSLTSLGCNDDFCGVQSSLTFPTIPGTVYRVRVGGFASAIGNFSINVSCAPTIEPNDECTGAIPVFDGLNGPFVTLGATTSSPWPCAVGGSDLWYSYVATCCGNLTVETCGGSYDTALEILDGSCGSLVSLACNDDACGLQSRVTVPVVIGTTYYIRLGGYNGARGTTPMTLTCTPAAPANDECAGAVPITAGPNGPFQNLCASTSAPLWGCAAGGNDVWFSFTPTATAPHTFSTCGASFDTAIEVFDGTCGALVSLGCNDDAGVGACAFTLQSALTVSLVASQTYYVRVGGFFGDRGTFPLNIAFGTSTGSFTTEFPGCGPTTITASGDPNIGGTVNFALGNLSGFGPTFIGFGFAIGSTPYCSCIVGHDWSALFFTTSQSLSIPVDPIWIGVSLGIQGAEFGVGGCPSPLLTFTDTIRMTIG